MTNTEAPVATSTGLILSGGGAKGAYHVGVVKALLELGGSIDMVAGASIGALNGAVLASAPTLREGVERLERLWQALADQSPVKPNVPAYFSLLAAAGLAISVPGKPLLGAIKLIDRIAQLYGLPYGKAFLDDQPLKDLMDEHLDLNGLEQGLPFYVSIFESQGGLADVMSCAVAELGWKDTPPSRFVHLQSLPTEDRKNALLASAALPLLYEARKVGGSEYTDGGQGGWQTAQGNTPITPLIEAGCRQVIVTHLSDGSLWNRRDFPNVAVLEIRPQSPITPDSSLAGAIKATMGFDRSNISRLMSQGFQDTMHCVGRVMKAATSRQKTKLSEHALNDSLRRGQAVDANLAETMSRLR